MGFEIGKTHLHPIFFTGGISLLSNGVQLVWLAISVRRAGKPTPILLVNATTLGYQTRAEILGVLIIFGYCRNAKSIVIQSLLLTAQP